MNPETVIPLTYCAEMIMIIHMKFGKIGSVKERLKRKAIEEKETMQDRLVTYGLGLSPLI